MDFKRVWYQQVDCFLVGKKTSLCLITQKSLKDLIAYKIWRLKDLFKRLKLNYNETLKIDVLIETHHTLLMI